MEQHYCVLMSRTLRAALDIIIFWGWSGWEPGEDDGVRVTLTGPWS